MKTHTRTTQTATDPAIDLFQHLGRAGLTDPYGCYRQLREHDPVHRTRHGLWVLTRHADVAAVLRDPRFGREGFERHFGTGGGSTASDPSDGRLEASRRGAAPIGCRRPEGSSRSSCAHCAKPGDLGTAAPCGSTSDSPAPGRRPLARVRGSAWRPCPGTKPHRRQCRNGPTRGPIVRTGGSIVDRGTRQLLHPQGSTLARPVQMAAVE